MKVLFVFNHPAPYKVTFFNELKKYVDLFVVFERNKAKNRPIEFYSGNNYDFNHVFLKKGAFGNENSNTKELKEFIKQHHNEYDLIVMNGYSTFTEMKAIKYMNKNHIPFILMINGGIKKDNEFFIKKNLKKKYISSASLYLSPSIVSNEYLNYYGANKDLIRNYPYSTMKEDKLFSQVLTPSERNRIREKWELPSNKLFVNASQFIDRKNNEQLLRIFKNRPDLSLVLIGNGPLKENYETFIKANKMSNVKLMNYLKNEEVLEIMAACDCHITLSKEDIYGHTIHEALSRGVPVISSEHVIAAKALIKDDYNGYVVPLEDDKILKAMDKVNEDMQLNALNSARENTIENCARIIASILQENKK